MSFRSYPNMLPTIAVFDVFFTDMSVEAKYSFCISSFSFLYTILLQPFIADALQNLTLQSFPHVHPEPWGRFGHSTTVTFHYSVILNLFVGQTSTHQPHMPFNFTFFQQGQFNSTASSSTVAIQELQEDMDQQTNVQKVYKAAYGQNFTQIKGVYSRARFPKKEKRKETTKLKGILKFKTTRPGQCSRTDPRNQKSGLISAKKMIKTKKGKAVQTPFTQENLRRSPRIEVLLDGHKVPTQHQDVQDQAADHISDQSAQQLATSNILSSFPGPVKFPTLTDLEKCDKAYPEIPAIILQELAVMSCSVPPEEVQLELLMAKEPKQPVKGSSLESKPPPVGDE